MCRRRKTPSRVSLTSPAARRTAKAPRPSIKDGLKPQAVLPAADSARTDNWTDVPETQNTVSRIPHFSGCAAHGKASRPSIENGLKPQAVLAARAIGRMQRTTRARRVPGSSTAMILFPDCATHAKGSASVHRRRFETARIVQSVGWVYHATSRIPRARRVPDDSPAMIPFPGCATRGKASRPSVEDGSKSCASSGGLNGCSAQPNVSLAPGAFRAVPLR